MLVSVTFTKTKYSTPETLARIDKTSADYLHIDLMDGKFVPPKQQLIPDLNKWLPNVKKPLDVHIMANDVLKYLAYFAEQNTACFTFHYEAVTEIDAMIKAVKETGLKVGLAISPKSSPELLAPYLKDLDQILVMSCEPGYGGTSFQESALNKIRYLKEQRAAQDYNYLISVDGGINAETIALVKEAGSDMVASGSYICMSAHYEEQINLIKNS